MAALAAAMNRYESSPDHDGATVVADASWRTALAAEALRQAEEMAARPPLTIGQAQDVIARLGRRVPSYWTLRRWIRERRIGWQTGSGELLVDEAKLRALLRVGTGQSVSHK